MDVKAVGPIRAAAMLARRLGPYLLIELLLPGGTMVALLLFLWRSRGGAAASPLATAIARLRGAARSLVDALSVDELVALAAHRPEDDGLEPLAMAPA